MNSEMAYSLITFDTQLKTVLSQFNSFQFNLFVYQQCNIITVLGDPQLAKLSILRV